MIFPPGLVVGLGIGLVLSQLLYAFWPYRRRRYALILAGTLLGLLGGQLWALGGLPGVGLGDANVVPAVIFAVALQPAVDRVPIRFPWW